MESQIQAAIIRRLRRDGSFVTKLIKTTTNGIPDLLIHRNGATAYIEVKLPGEKPTPLQQYRIKELATHGIPSITASSVEECLTKLQGII
jgi:hypothetical protein